MACTISGQRRRETGLHTKTTCNARSYSPFDLSFPTNSSYGMDVQSLDLRFCHDLYTIRNDIPLGHRSCRHEWYTLGIDNLGTVHIHGHRNQSVQHDHYSANSKRWTQS